MRLERRTRKDSVSLDRFIVVGDPIDHFVACFAELLRIHVVRVSNDDGGSVVSLWRRDEMAESEDTGTAATAKFSMEGFEEGHGPLTESSHSYGHLLTLNSTSSLPNHLSHMLLQLTALFILAPMNLSHVMA